jgi:hypothetical protein
VQRGLSYAPVEEIVRRAFVGAADMAHPDLLPRRKVSRISTATGINRREVARLLAVIRYARAAQPLPPLLALDSANAQARQLVGELRARQRD